MKKFMEALSVVADICTIILFIVWIVDSPWFSMITTIIL